MEHKHRRWSFIISLLFFIFGGTFHSPSSHLCQGAIFLAPKMEFFKMKENGVFPKEVYYLVGQGTNIKKQETTIKVHCIKGSMKHVPKI